MSGAFSDVSVTTKVLQLVQVGGTQIISSMMAERGYGGRWNASALFHHTMDGLVVNMIGYLAADRLETVSISYPRDWREAVKARFAPKWALKRWPVRETKHEIKLDAIYPKMALPEKCGPYIRVVQHTQPYFYEEGADGL